MVSFTLREVYVKGAPCPRTYSLSAWKSYLLSSVKLRVKGYLVGLKINFAAPGISRLMHIRRRPHDFQGSHCRKSRDHKIDPRHLLQLVRLGDYYSKSSIFITNNIWEV